jgi:hypothetical protein
MSETSSIRNDMPSYIYADHQVQPIREILTAIQKVARSNPFVTLYATPGGKEYAITLKGEEENLHHVRKNKLTYQTLYYESKVISYGCNVSYDAESGEHVGFSFQRSTAKIDNQLHEFYMFNKMPFEKWNGLSFGIRERFVEQEALHPDELLQVTQEVADIYLQLLLDKVKNLT